MFFKMPTFFIEPDSIEKNFRFAKSNKYIKFKIISEDSSILIYIESLLLSKEMEDKIKLFFPDVDLTKEYLKYISYLCKTEGETIFDNKNIKYYKKRLLNKINADIAVEYLIKLKKPFENKYKYLKFTHIQKYYTSKIEIYQFCENLDKKYDKELSKMIGYKEILSK